MIVKKACSFSYTYCEELEQAKYLTVHCWNMHYSLVYCMGTKEVEQDPQVSIADALNFILATKQKLRQHDFILNMDQIPIFDAWKKDTEYQRSEND